MRLLPPRIAFGSVALALVALMGLVIGPAPAPARGALVATGVNDSYSVKHDRLAVIPAPGVLANDLNLLGGASAILMSDVSHGTLSLQSNGGFSYTPDSGYLGSDAFRYRPSGVLSTTATVTITVTNAAPVANPDAYTWASGNLFVPAPGVLGNDTDADGDALVAEMDGGGVSGSLDLGSDGSISYSPGGGFSGSVTFSYRAWDGLAWSGVTSVTLTRSAATPAPTPSPTPTPTPTASSTPVAPLPTPSAPVALPSGSLLQSPIPSLGAPLPSTGLLLPTPSPSSGGSPSPGVTSTRVGASASAAGDPSDGTVASSAGAFPPSGSDGVGGSGSSSLPGPGPSDGRGRSSSHASIAFDDEHLDLNGIAVGLLGGIEIWAVPAATIAVPGLLLLIWLALQAIGAMAWLPATRRLQRGWTPGHRRRRR